VSISAQPGSNGAEVAKHRKNTVMDVIWDIQGFTALADTMAIMSYVVNVLLFS
jgi:hypothetical protein